jgi:kynureninase
VSSVKAAPRRAAERDLLKRRDEFPILKDSIYLISHSMGAMPRRAFDYLGRYATEWSSRGILSYDRWMPMILEHGNLIGRLIGAAPNTVVMHQNVSTLMSIVISAIFQPGGRTKAVYTELNFPSVHYNWAMHRRMGLDVRLVRSPDGIHIPTERFVDAIDEKTLAVVIDHGVFRSSFLQDVRTIARAARSRGAYSIVDAYQTIGCVPVDVQAWDADFVLGGSHKWLCGGPGAAYLYVHPRLLRDLEPRVTGWFSHKRPFAFEMEMEFAEDAMRFATGTPSIPSLYAARAGTEIVSEVGVDRIRAKSARQTTRLIEQALENGFRVNSPTDSKVRAGMVCIDFPGAERAERELLKRRFHVDYRPRCGLRVSPHFYTTDDELDALIAELRKMRRRK